MERMQVECLGCGERRSIHRAEHRSLLGGECPRCGYLGWAPSEDLSERVRKLVRERPVQRRRFHLVSR